MFVLKDEISATDLLQGDIIAGVQLIGAVTVSSIHLITPATGGDPTGWAVQAPPSFGAAMVLSHSCELARENGVKVTSIILAPLRDVSSAMSLDKMDLLVDSNLIDQTDGKASFLKYFYVEPHEVIGFERGAVVDFSKCFSVRKKSYAYLLEHKALQLRDDVRDSMALKLALYFHRQNTTAAA